MKKGKIYKLLGGFYSIVDAEGRTYESRAKGVFRHQNQKPVVGDDVFFTPGEKRSTEEPLSYIEKICPRKNLLLRPPVANVDQLLLLIPVDEPKYNLMLIDRLLAYYESIEIPVIIGISKITFNERETEKLKETYEKAGYEVALFSLENIKDNPWLREKLHHHTTALTGVSGAGKSTLTNQFLGLALPTQTVSEKTKRGRHTTRHTELMIGENETYLFDTAGFSNVNLEGIESKELDDYFKEFHEYKHNCKFLNCNHVNEPGCAVRAARESGKISDSRYENYVKIFESLKEEESRRWQ